MEPLNAGTPEVDGRIIKMNEWKIVKANQLHYGECCVCVSEGRPKRSGFGLFRFGNKSWVQAERGL